MITCNENGEVVVEAEGGKYRLSSSEEYAAFLLLITSPDDNVNLGKEAFDVDTSLGETEAAKAERYSEFLCHYAEERKSKLAEFSTESTFEQQQSEIVAFIEKLKNQEKTT